MATATLTMAEMIDRAINDGDAFGEVTYTPFIHGTVLSPGLAAMIKQRDGVFWMLTAIASWVIPSWVLVPGAEINDDGFDEDGMNEPAYRRLIERWADMRESMQCFDLRRHGPRGAELCVRGGTNGTEDDSLTLHPIQRWVYAEMPWSDDEPLRVWAGRSIVNGRDVWVLMLPREY
jgi:hypothetical protein